MFAYTYDDGPTKIVTESTLAQFDVLGGTMTTVARSGGEKETDTVEGYAQLANGRGVLVTTGQRTLDGMPVETRTTWLIQRNLLESTLESRRSGGSYSFRHAYIFTRVLPPPATGEAALSSAR